MDSNISSQKEVLIFGATRGLGLALAKHYLALGSQVTVCGRNTKQVPNELFTQYPLLRAVTLDVSNPHQLASFVVSLTKAPDLCIYCAGCYFNERRAILSQAETEQMFAVNKYGFDDCFRLISQKMLTQGQGHLVAISSVAGTISSKNPSLYARLKAQMIRSSLDYRAALSPFGIKVTVIAPGYIDTEKLRELNGGSSQNKPWVLPEAQAVLEIASAISTNKALHIFPKPMKYLAKLLNFLPDSLTEQLLVRRK